MLQYNFDRIFKARAVEHPFTYLIKAGFSHSFALKIANNNVKRIHVRELEKLCWLLRCTPNDVMQWIPDESMNIDSNHPLYKIKASDKVINMVKVLNSVPLDKIDEIEELIQEKLLE